MARLLTYYSQNVLPAVLIAEPQGFGLYSLQSRLRMIRVDQSRYFFAFVLAGAAFAQSNGSISGTVQDSHGGVIQDGAVTVSNPLGGVSQTTRTNSEGNFIFPQ